MEEKMIGVIIDPKFEDIAENKQLLAKIPKQNSIVLTLCSPFQFEFFKEQGYNVYDIGETVFTLEERDLCEQQIYGAEWLCYLKDDECYPGFPFNPAAYLSNPLTAIAYSIPQLIKSTQYCGQQGLKNLIIIGYPSFTEGAAATLRRSNYKFTTNYISQKKQNKNLNFKIAVKIFIRDTLILLKGLFSSKTLVIYQDAVHTRHFLQKSEYKKNVLLKVKRKVFFGNKIFNGGLIKKLDYNLEKALTKAYNYITDPLSKEAAQIAVEICRKNYGQLLSVINYYRFIHFLKKDAIWVAEANQGIYNPLVHIFKDTKTIYCDHGPLCDLYRMGAYIYHEFTHAQLYSKLYSSNGAFNWVTPNCKEVAYMPPFYANPIIQDTADDEVKYILFAPTTERHFYMDFQIKEFFEICEKLNQYCKAKGNLKVLVRFHPITPYRQAMHKKLKELECIEITAVNAARTLQDDLRKCYTAILTGSSNTIVECFFHKKAAVILVDRPRHDLLPHYDKNLKMVYNIEDTLKRTDELLMNREDYLSTVANQTAFLEKYICLH